MKITAPHRALKSKTVSARDATRAWDVSIQILGERLTTCEPPGLRALYAEAGATAPEIVVESFDHHIDTEQFWTIVLGSGYRGPLEAIGPEAAARVRDGVT